MVKERKGFIAYVVGILAGIVFMYTSSLFFNDTFYAFFGVSMALITVILIEIVEILAERRKI